MELRQAQQAIQRVLRDNLFARQVLATSGSLEFNRLAKYRTSKRLFARKQAESGKLYNFIILIDCSGSMGGTRFHWAITAAKNLAKLLKHVCNLEFRLFNMIEWKMTADEILAMDPTVRRREMTKVYIWVKQIGNEKRSLCHPTDIWCKHRLNDSSIDDYNEILPWRSLVGDVECQDWTAEAYHLISARKDIRHKQGKNVILLLHDGEPNYPYWTERDNLLSVGVPVIKHKMSSYGNDIKKIERDVELVSMWIQTDKPRDQFSNFVYINNPNDIYKNVVILFERLIRDV
jgi:hypothetical protein